MGAARLAVLLPVRADGDTLRLYREALEPYARGVEVDVVGLPGGLEQIETAYDDTVTAPLVVEAVQRLWREGYQGVLINCFDAPGLEASREKVPIPEVGAGLASYAAASLIASRCSEITVGGWASARIVHQQAARYGCGGKLARVYVLEEHVLDIEREGEGLAERVAELALESWRRDHVDAVLLGCTGFTPLARRVQELVGRRPVVIDPTVWGFLMLRSLVETRTPSPFYLGAQEEVA